MWNQKIRLPRSWKTEQAYQVINLLKESHIRARTEPDVFNRPFDSRMLSRDPETVWPVFVRKRTFERAVAILKAERLL